MAFTVDGTARADLDQLVTEQERDPITATVGEGTGVSDPITAAYSSFDTGTCLKKLEGEWRQGMGITLIGGGTSGVTTGTGLATTGGSGTGLTCDIVTVSGGQATELAVAAAGNGAYVRGETITIAAATHGGVGDITFKLGSGA